MQLLQWRTAASGHEQRSGYVGDGSASPPKSRPFTVILEASRLGQICNRAENLSSAVIRRDGMTTSRR